MSRGRQPQASQDRNGRLRGRPDGSRPPGGRVSRPPVRSRPPAVFVTPRI